MGTLRLLKRRTSRAERLWWRYMLKSEGGSRAVGKLMLVKYLTETDVTLRNSRPMLWSKLNTYTYSDRTVPNA